MGVSFVGRGIRGSRLVYRLSDGDQRSVACVELDDDGVAQRAVRHAIAKHHPPPPLPTLSPPGVGDVNGLVGAIACRIAMSQHDNRATGGVITEDAVVPTGRA